MGLNGPPAVVIIARHGARLDAADDQWQASSSTPYDTPLSYGGWTQTRALGARIASLLHARDVSIARDESRPRRPSADAATTPLPSHHSALPSSGRKYKVIIHSSPFLRCIQSSIAVSAGMAHYHGNLVRIAAGAGTDGSERDAPPPESVRSPRLFGQPSRSQTLDSKAFDERLSKNSTQGKATRREENLPEFQRPGLRVDAFLGEWLSPQYYEFIAAPPPSAMMVAGAKADLLKPGEPIRGAKIVEHDGSVTTFPTAESAQDHEPHSNRTGRDRGSSFSMDTLARNLPGHGANSKSLDSGKDKDGKTANGVEQPRKPARNIGYMPPTPTYALLPKAPIPIGYVEHARERCINVDFQWDSMREPQSWGDGGEYGEEWSAMHRRFRSGFSNMISWYRTNGPDYDPQEEEEEEEEDSNEKKEGVEEAAEVVLVIVTHGAGCNALIGALTNQPVLMDVGMGSLTMAVRKPRDATSPTERPRSNSQAYRRRRSSSVDLGLNQEYDMKLIASTEHLRAGADPLTIPQLAAGERGMPSIPESNPGSGTSTPRERASSFSKNSALGSMRRTSVKTKSSRAYSPSPVLTSATSSGLWGGSGSSTTPVTTAAALATDAIEATSPLPPPAHDHQHPGELHVHFAAPTERGSSGVLEESDEALPPKPQAIASPTAETPRSASQPGVSSHRQGLWGSGPGASGSRRGSTASNRR